MPEIGRSVGTNGAALVASGWDAALATILDNFSAGRIGNLDNIDASLLELFYEHFASTVDDLTGVSADGTAANPDQLVDNIVATAPSFDVVNQYIDINLGAVAYVKRMRYHGHVNSNPGSRYRLQAYVGGAWLDCLTGIVDIDLSEWDSWRNLTTPRTAILWRLECTTRVVAALVSELELDGVSIG